MIIRIILALFISLASGISYLAGYVRLMSGLLAGFGVLVSAFFGILFVVPAESRDLWFPVYGQGSGWPFFLLAGILAIITALIFTRRRVRVTPELVSSIHFQYLVGGVLSYLLTVYLPTLLWFPSEERRLGMDADSLGQYVFAGTCLYIIGTIVSLYLFYLASRGGAPNYPDVMRRLVLAVFSVFHLDKVPALVAFLMIYSPETNMIYPGLAAFALSAYIPITLFLLKLSWQSDIREG